MGFEEILIIKKEVITYGTEAERPFNMRKAKLELDAFISCM